MATFGEKVIVQVAEDRPEAVGVVDLPTIRSTLCAKPIALCRQVPCQPSHEDIGRPRRLQKGDDFAAGGQRLNALGRRNDGANGPSPFDPMGPEKTERVTVIAGRQGAAVLIRKAERRWVDRW